MSAVSKLSLRRDPIRLVLSRGPWAAARYLLGYLAVGGVLFGTWLQQRVRTETIGLLFALLMIAVAVDLIA